MRKFSLQKSISCLALSALLLFGLPGSSQAEFQVQTGDAFRQTRRLKPLSSGKDFIRKAFAESETGNFVDPALHNWPHIGLGRLGLYDGLDDYLSETEKYISQEWQSASRKVTNLERIVLTVGAAKGNPRDFGGRDLIAEICNFPDIEAQGLNGPVFALIALDSGNYEIPVAAKWTREKLLDIILSRQLPDGGFSLNGSGGRAPDITAMTLQALAPYNKAGRQDVQAVVKKALTALSGLQDAQGGYRSWGTSNSESAAQALIALCSLGIDPDADSRFIKNGHTLTENLLTFRAADGGFKHVADGKSNNMASEQALIALASYVRFKDQSTALYDYSDLVFPNAQTEDPAKGVWPENELEVQGDGGAALKVPARALSDASLKLKISAATAASFPAADSELVAYDAAKTAVELEPGGTEFLKPALLSLPLSARISRRAIMDGLPFMSGRTGAG
jgi:hypothetical protein